MWLTGKQPIRYGSRRVLKSNSLILLARGPIVSDPAPNHWYIVCHGNKRHYQAKTGQCVHVEELAKSMRPWHRSRSYYLPFGEPGGTHKRVPQGSENG